MRRKQREYLVDVEVTRRIEVVVSATSRMEAIEKADSMEWNSERVLETLDWAVKGEPILNE